MNKDNFIHSFLKRLRAGAHQDPIRDWLVLVIVSLIILAGIIVWNVWAFSAVAGGGVIGAPATSTPMLFNRASLDAIHTISENRAAEEAKYVTGAYRYTDPSQ